MALNPEPADPLERHENGLPGKSYAEAAAPETNPSESDASIDETAIKESPPRLQDFRNGSTRSLDGVIDGSEPSSPSSRTNSPALRHPKGRLEEKDSRENYAAALRSGERLNGELYGGSNDSPNGKSNGYGDGNDRANGNGHVAGNVTPEEFEGAGVDEAPRSPTNRKSHRRTSSNKLNGAYNKEVSETTPTTTRSFKPEDASDGAETASGLVYENVWNKSGENLASMKPSNGYYMALAQRENKPGEGSTGPRQNITRRQTDLVSGRRAGAGWSTSAIRWAPWNVPLQRRVQTLLVLLHTLSIAGGLAIFFLLCTIPLLWPILVPYLLYVLMSRAAIDGKNSHRSEWLRNSKIWSLFGSYFPARLHRSQPLEPTRKYIFGYHPHGIISHGAFAAFATEALGFSQLFPGITNSLLTLDANFRIPLYRDYALRMGINSVSRESCENLLRKGGPNGEGMGRAITIVVGGARESLDARPYSLKLVLKRRKGFVKLALRTGADLVPVLAFGENEIYEQLNTDEHPYVHRAQMLVKKFMGFTVPLFHARGMFALTIHCYAPYVRD